MSLETLWYNKTAQETIDELKTHEHGLSEQEIEERYKTYGKNKLPDGKVDSIFVIFLHQFQSPLIYILCIAAVIIFSMGDMIDGFIILIVLLFNAIIGTVQEGKAQNTLLALKKFVETSATVLRDNKEIIIPDSELVPGDIIILQEGEKIPADARIIISTNLKIDESSLTGESEPTNKIIDKLDQVNITTVDQKNMVFKGTHILSGSGKAIVVTTGVNTVIGKISKEITQIDTEIPLKKNIKDLSKLIIIIVGFISLILFVYGTFTGRSALEMFNVAVSLSVSIIPEGLPMVITLVLSTGVWRMSKRNALVKKLQAVEALGQATIIAVDKTGTLTRNEMVVNRVFVNDMFFEIDGEGYEPKGNFTLNENIVDPVSHPECILMAKLAAFSANARIMYSEEKKEWKIAGDPTEAAMLVLAQKIGIHKEELENESPLVAEIPFDYRLKYHATVHAEQNKKILSVVGAPEIILKLSNKVWKNGKSHELNKEEKEKLENIFLEMSGKGLRVIAIAESNDVQDILSLDLIKDLTFVGFFGIKDALRVEVADAMQQASSAGIKVVMITGDHKITAEAIGKEAGIFKDNDIVLTGQEIDDMSEDELLSKLKKVSVFARVTPEHKFKIIQAYKKIGEVVAMTGDGVNDAPSLVAADLGVSMGKIGTEVAKEASDIVLLDDNFASIIAAVEEGRSIYKTIKKVLLYLFSTSIGEALVILTAIFLGYPLPLSPAQIIWLNFVTDGFLVVALAMEQKESGLLKKKFNKQNKYLVDKLMSARIIMMGIVMLIGTMFLFTMYLHMSLVKAMTIALTVLAVFQWFNAWNCRHESESILKSNPFTNMFLVAMTFVVITLQSLIIYNPTLQSIFKTVPLNLNEWIMIISVASSIILIEEIRKLFHRIYYRSHRPL